MLPISFEFYPPKTDEQRTQLDRSVQKLKAHAPQFMSVTFGAGGSTLSHTPETVQRLRSEHGVAGVPHITCVGGNREEIRQLLKLYRALGCDRVVALRGDTPSGMVRSGDLRYASELVELIRAEHGDHFHVEVAAYPETHPQADDAHVDLRNFKTKVEVVNLAQLDKAFNDGDTVNEEALRKAGLINRACEQVKVLGQGEISKKLTLVVDTISASAKEKVEKAGGSVQLPA
jgi:methylenetetrahydrofolate reductase (NADPH)